MYQVAVKADGISNGPAQVADSFAIGRSGCQRLTKLVNCSHTVRVNEVFAGNLFLGYRVAVTLLTTVLGEGLVLRCEVTPHLDSSILIAGFWISAADGITAC